MDNNNTELLAKLRGMFKIEAEEHLQAIAKDLLTLEHGVTGEEHAALLEALYREVHTLKGAARAVNLTEIETICQAVESVCAPLKRGEWAVWPALFDTLHRAMDTVQQLNAAAREMVPEQVAGVMDELAGLEAQGLARMAAAAEAEVKPVSQPVVNDNGAPAQAAELSQTASSKQDELLAKLREMFKVEAEEHLQAIAKGLLTLEHGAAGEEHGAVLEALYREVHTLKGAARAVNLTEIEAICQAVESVCTPLKRGEWAVWPALFDTLHRAMDTVQQLTAAAEGIVPEELAAVMDELAGLEAQGLAHLTTSVDQGSLPAEKQAGVDEKSPVSTAEQGTGHYHAPAGSRDPRQAEPQPAKEQHPPTETAPVAPRNGASLPKERPATNGVAASASIAVQASATVPVSSSPRTTASRQRMKTAKEQRGLTETIRVATTKLDSLFLQAEEMLAVKLKIGQHAAELRELTVMLSAWKREWAKVHTEIRKTQRLLEREENRNSPDPIYPQAAQLVEFLDWTNNHLKALDRQLNTLTRTVAQDQQSLGTMVDNLVEDAKKVLMLPFASVLEILPKMVRDLSRTQGKDVELVLQGGEVEIDKRILEEMKDPLIHLLRNSIDHGIEKPAERERQNKSPRGIISVVISPGEANTVDLVISDDGAGIDLVKVKAAAVRCRLLSQKEADRLGDQEALSLIFQSEVSTSPVVSEISGRGLGMAIVREKVEKLGGQISAETQRQQGTAFRIRLPLTLATFRGILVQAASQNFVIPTANVERVVRIKRDEVHTVGNKETLTLNGYTLPLVRLEQTLGLAKKSQNRDGPRYLSALLLGTAENRIAFGVDAVLNEQEVLFKSLGRQLARVRNVAGATVLGSGQVVPILNVSDLLKSAGAGAIARVKAATAATEEETNKKSVLVVEDSITSRMLLKEILESSGYVVTTAIDGADAFALLQKAHFDLVISDVEMPRMNGFDLTTKLRSDEKYAKLPVVLVTGLESRADRERGIDAGANAYVVKGSFDQSNLLETISRLI